MQQIPPYCFYHTCLHFNAKMKHSCYPSDEDVLGVCNSTISYLEIIQAWNKIEDSSEWSLANTPIGFLSYFYL